MPLVALIVTDKHNEAAIYSALPPGTVFTIIELSRQEWALPAERISTECAVPLVAQSQQEWHKQLPAHQ